MEITVKFSSIGEMEDFARKVLDKAPQMRELTRKELNETTGEAVAIINAAEEKMAREESAPAPKDVSKLKAEVRKLLNAVNKQEGKNQAKEWIKNLGHASLADVDGEEDLMTLKGLSEEVLNA